MNVPKIFLLAVVFIAGFCWSVMADNSGRIYGKITTVDGDVLEGLIRWDKNEGSWVDILNGQKELSRKNLRDVERKTRQKYSSSRSIKIFGIKIADDDSHYSSWSSMAQSGIRFGHIKTMEFIGDDRVLLVLKSGEEVEMENYSTDIGTGIREIIIEDLKEGELELVWDDIETIEFMPASSSEKSVYGERLYGTLTTRRGDTFSGYVCWDVDELFEEDVLDGEESKRTRKIKFGKIASISRYSSSGATVVLKTGEEMVLRGTNDVDNDNRGVVISDPDLGDVVVKWDDFDKLEFKTAPRQVKYNEFDGGRPLRGTVYTDDGSSYKGTIRWDNDEEYTWEILDGDNRDIEFNIEFSNIKEIKRKSYRGSEVTLWDNRMFYLRGSNDVDEDNKGIIITLDDGDEVVVEWDEFDRLEFTK